MSSSKFTCGKTTLYFLHILFVCKPRFDIIRYPSLELYLLKQPRQEQSFTNSALNAEIRCYDFLLRYQFYLMVVNIGNLL